jgi:hypothetical protein
MIVAILSNIHPHKQGHICILVIVNCKLPTKKNLRQGHQLKSGKRSSSKILCGPMLIFFQKFKLLSKKKVYHFWTLLDCYNICEPLYSVVHQQGATHYSFAQKCWTMKEIKDSGKHSRFYIFAQKY